MSSAYSVLFISMVCFSAFLGAGCQKQAPKEKIEASASRTNEADRIKTSADITSAMQGAKLLDEALNAQFGVDSIKAAQQWTARQTGTYMGMPFSGITSFDGQSMRMDVSMPGGEQMSFVMGGKYCWSKTGPVVVPCSADARKAYGDQFKWENAARLFPLKQEGWVVKKDITDMDHESYPTLLISNRNLQGQGRLIFDPESKLLIKSVLPMVFNGRKGKMETEYLDYKKKCGTLMPMHTISTFDGKKVMEDKTEQYFCGPVEQDLFPQPLQVADRTFLQHTTAATTAYCMTIKAEPSDMGSAIAGLLEKIAENKWVSMGPAFAIFDDASGPADKKAPKMTKLCMPVSAPPPKQAKVVGDYSLEVFPAKKVLSVYGLGDYSKAFDRLSKLLAKELKTRKLKKSGPMMLVYHHSPSDVAINDQVSELSIALK